MTPIAITGLGLTGVLRTTWVHDNLAHVLDHSHTDETSGTWTGLACPGHGLALGADVDNTMLHDLAARSEIADLIWEAPDELTAEHGKVFHAAIRAHHAACAERAEELWDKVRTIWSQAWSANYAMLEFMQGTGLTRFSPVKPQQWVVASFEHHTSLHGLPRPHIHNIVLTAMTTAARLTRPNLPMSGRHATIFMHSPVFRQCRQRSSFRPYVVPTERTHRRFSATGGSTISAWLGTDHLSGFGSHDTTGGLGVQSVAIRMNMPSLMENFSFLTL